MVTREQRLQIVQHPIGRLFRVQAHADALRGRRLEGDRPVVARTQAGSVQRGVSVGVEAAQRTLTAGSRQALFRAGCPSCAGMKLR